jgi:pyridoxine 5-phosphate synthase
MTKLSVNINKVATIRNARGTNIPNLIQVAKDCESFGAQGITVHPRPDERHIKYADVYDLKKMVTTEFNIEGYPNKKFIDLVMTVKPEQVTLVPDRPDVLTSNAGWDTQKNFDMLREIVSEFNQAGIRTSLFMDCDTKGIEWAAKTGANRIELYTEAYASGYTSNREQAIKEYKQAAIIANQQGLALNAGHDLNLENLQYLKENLIGLQEVSIGHALICDALYFGLQNTIQMYLNCLKEE